MIVALGLLGGPAAAEDFGGGSLHALGYIGRLADSSLSPRSCDALRRDVRLRNTVQPSRRKALLQRCRDLEQGEVRIAARPFTPEKGANQP